MSSENPGDEKVIAPNKAVEAGDETKGKLDPSAETSAKADDAAAKSPTGFSRRLDIKGSEVAPALASDLRNAEGELAELARVDDETEADTDPVTGKELTPEEAAAAAKNAEILKARGVELEVDRRIGDKMESEVLADFLEKNPEIDASTLMIGLGQRMTDEEFEEAIAEMTPEEYQKFLAEMAESIAKTEAAEAENGEPIDATRTLEDGTTEENAFALSGVGSGNGNPDWRPSSHTGGVSGRMDVPQVSNAELVSAVEGLASRLSPPADPAALKAVVAVESGGDMGATRYEPHHGHKGRDEATSFGAFQIMGFNAESLGYASATAMKEAFQTGGVDEQVNAFGKFLETRNLTPHIAANRDQPDFRSFAHGYNGAAYAKLNYHGKMEAAYQRYKNESTAAMV